MLVKELIAALQEQDQDALVVMSKDSEGNRFSPLDEACAVVYLPNSTYAGELLNPDDEDESDEDSWSDRLANSQAAVCLWPVN